MNLARVLVGVEFVVDADDKEMVDTVIEYVHDNMTGISGTKTHVLLPDRDVEYKDIPDFLAKCFKGEPN